MDKMVSKQQIIDALAFYGTNKAAAEALGVSDATLTTMRKECGLPLMKRGPQSKRPSREFLKEVIEKHRTNRAVAEALGVTDATVSNWRRDYGMGPIKKDDVYQRVVEDLHKVKVLYVFFGWGQQKLADKWDCSKTVINRVLNDNGITRRDVRNPTKELEEDLEIIELKYHEQGWTASRIADEWDVPEFFVRKVLNVKR